MADTYDLAELRVMQGHLHLAKAVLGDALKWAAEQGVQQMPATSMVYVKLGDVLREQNDLQAAEDHLLAGIELSEGGLAAQPVLATLSSKRIWPCEVGIPPR
jgi:hypothetical protein